MTNPVRSILAIFGGLLLLRLLDLVLVLAHPLSCVLVGYMIAKVAREQEIRHAAAAAAIQTGIYAWGFATLEANLLPPMWMRIVMLVLTAPAMLLGASTRAKARLLESPAPAAEPEERS
jgi:hypothetical protein